MFTVIKNNKFTGTSYESLNSGIKKFHYDRGDLFLEVNIKPDKIQPADIEVEPGLSYTPEEIFVDPTAEQLELALIGLYEYITEQHIQVPIDEYNKLNGIKLKDAHNCANYINNPAYSHYDFCVKAWNFNVEVWEFTRQLQIDVTAGIKEKPASIEDFKLLLPVFV